MEVRRETYQLALFRVSTVDVILVCRLFSQMFFAANCGWSSRPTGRWRERSRRTWGRWWEED